MKVLMVDVDGVLVHGRPGDGLHYCTYLERDLGLRRDVLQEEFFRKDHWNDVVTGRDNLEPRLASVLQKIAPGLSAATLIDYWFSNDSGLNRTLLADLAALRAKGIPMYLATNQEHRRAAYLMETLELSSYFDGIFYSAMLGYQKPAPEFFRLATERVGIAPNEIAFIDDYPANIEAARQFGWKAMHWAPGSRLEDALAVFSQ
ncbi:HAD-IA family hydrolase [Rhizobium leucaenae]|uniref:Putative hydrolase of the HAD superfamily n=1 Tax=Rhizobium leucaenae TaxID=29450 RepID=A0A7W6ZT06_9HYPH|nr:HAD-IA family hydrolase [Rhizobium leucaenae]MBB4567673.1 putative hydrolase of the HAD superfamily [Rhizobium leucaenae]MBB6301761.1 putative hydrolase of the HAD superfamily [Rhizobium leucaenae]